MNKLVNILLKYGYKHIIENLYANKDKWIEIKYLENSHISYKYFISFQNSDILLYDSNDDIKISTMITNIKKQSYTIKAIQHGFLNNYNQPYSRGLTNDELIVVANKIINNDYDIYYSIRCDYSLEIHLDNMLNYKEEYTNEDNEKINLYSELIDDINLGLKINFFCDSNYMKFFNGIIRCFHCSYDTEIIFYFIDENSLREAIEIIKKIDIIREIRKKCIGTIYEFQCFIVLDYKNKNLIHDYYKNIYDDFLVQFYFEHGKYNEKEIDNLTDIVIKKIQKNEKFEIKENCYKCLCQNLIKLNVENLDVLMKILMRYNNINIDFYMQLKFDEKVSHKFDLQCDLYNDNYVYKIEHETYFEYYVFIKSICVECKNFDDIEKIFFNYDNKQYILTCDNMKNHNSDFGFFLQDNKNTKKCISFDFDFNFPLKIVKNISFEIICKYEPQIFFEFINENCFVNLDCNGVIYL